MRRLVMVSNRVAMPKGSSAPGGLAVGVLGALRGSEGVWFGWNGEISESGGTRPDIVVRDGVTYATLALTPRLHELFYSGFANGTLWPLFHYFLDGFRYHDEEYQAYQEVNELFARHLLALLKPDDLIWVHDYHLIPLAERLRARDVRSRIGFFLHIPFPNFEILRALPKFTELMRALLTYDVVGFQSEPDRQAFLGTVRAVYGYECLRADGAVAVDGRTVATGVFPIGVDIDAVARSAAKAWDSAPVQRMHKGLLGRRLIVGVDRLDYSKGLLERFEAYRYFLEHYPEHQGNVTYLQIAPVGREKVEAYARLRDSLEQSAGSTNGRFADAHWTPIRYLNRNFPHGTLMGFLRAAQACLVTPVRDGMNLVAKEFIAAQDSADPGVLVLSDRTGAACELSDALLVNPYDAQGIAQALDQALRMPLAERQARQEKLLVRLREHDIHQWRERFLQVLTGAELLPAQPGAQAPAGLSIEPAGEASPPSDGKRA